MTHTTDIDAPSMGQWAHDIADQYRGLAVHEGWEPRRRALETEAAKYDGIAHRMDRIKSGSLLITANPATATTTSVIPPEQP